MNESDAIKINRATLNQDLEPEKLFVAQKYMIEKANLAGKPIIRSQLLESMEGQSQPSRAEISDVSNAILDGSDYVMLSGKITSGKYLFQSLELLGKCCVEAEKMMEFKVMHHRDDSVFQMMGNPEQAEKDAQVFCWMTEADKFFDRKVIKTSS